MASRFVKGGKMQEQINLFQVDESYNLAELKKICYDYVKKKYTRTECEDISDYLSFLQDEADLEFAIRIKKIASDIEKRILGR